MHYVLGVDNKMGNVQQHDGISDHVDLDHYNNQRTPRTTMYV